VQQQRWAKFLLALMLPPQIINYLIAHEIAHLNEPHHGPTFW
jgi:predicted metal-dependent hydrolase